MKLGQWWWSDGVGGGDGGGVNTGIRYSLSFEQYEAVKAAGLDLWKWENNEYPKWFKAKVIAHHRLTGLIENNRNDAVAKDAKRKAKKRK